MFNDFVKFVQDLYETKEEIALHSPSLGLKEKEYVAKSIDSTFVSSVGRYVTDFEGLVADYTNAKYAVATINGTSALHIALKLSGASSDTEVITQSFTFVATCNAIYYCNASPIFVDIDKDTLGMSPKSLNAFLYENAEIRNDGFCWNKSTNKKIVACLPMHSFGHPVRLGEIKSICDKYNIKLVEDAAESLGSMYHNTHTGLVGEVSAISFNGNKIITTGGGGMILTNNKDLYKKAKHITTTAKIQHKWNIEHDIIGYNYRLPNINAALGMGQMERINEIIYSKRNLANNYQSWGLKNGIRFFKELNFARSNYWLNVALMDNKNERNLMLKVTNKNNILTRPSWVPMHKLKINAYCQKGELKNTIWAFDRVVNVPSSPVFNTFS